MAKLRTSGGTRSSDCYRIAIFVPSKPGDNRNDSICCTAQGTGEIVEAEGNYLHKLQGTNARRNTVLRLMWQTQFSPQ